MKNKIIALVVLFLLLVANLYGGCYLMMVAARGTWLVLPIFWTCIGLEIFLVWLIQLILYGE